jgi:uncharacterized protein (DUF4415 family)
MRDTVQTTRAVTTTDGQLLIEQPDGSYRPAAAGQTDWARVDATTEAELERAIADDPDDPANDPSFWQHAALVQPVAKQRITLRVDRDVLAFFKSTRIQAVLRAYVEAHRR